MSKEQIQTEKPAEKKTETPVETTPKDLENEELQSDTDALLDEIDAVLEENCEEFVKNYVQRGGE